MTTCTHADRVTSGVPGEHVVSCQGCGITLSRTNRAVWAMVGDDPARAGAFFNVARIEAAKLGHGRLR